MIFSRIPNLDQITLDEDGLIHIGPMVTHNQCAASKIIREFVYPLARASWEVGSPQIRNRGTVAGNMITASPANDTISPLMALGAKVLLRSKNGERIVPLIDFYKGVRRTVMTPDEMLIEIMIPSMTKNQKGIFTKFALRQAQAISLVNVAIILELEQQHVKTSSITLGAVAPVIIHAKEAEDYLAGKELNEQTILQTAELAMNAAKPISDVRGSAGYRKKIVKIITQRGLRSILHGSEREGFPEHPVLLRGKPGQPFPTVGETVVHNEGTPIETTINGVKHTFTTGQNKTLLRLLREEAGMTGTKEGCAEGECGACTVFLDGIAVMSCMVPAPRAHGAEIVTVEGIGNNGDLHPVQKAFIEHGAVQCGYCTPGFIMSAAKLLEEVESPTNETGQTGNNRQFVPMHRLL